MAPEIPRHSESIAVGKKRTAVGRTDPAQRSMIPGDCREVLRGGEVEAREEGERGVRRYAAAKPDERNKEFSRPVAPLLYSLD